MKESYVFLAEGFEELEALAPVDVLRRAGIPVKTVSITDSLQVTGSHGVTITTDVLFADTDFEGAEWIIFPGGMPGATHLHEFEPLKDLIRSQLSSKSGRVAAICASPAVVLGQEGFLEGHKATCYPGFEKMLKGAEYMDVRVVVDGRFVLGNGPSSALKWALTIVGQTLNEEKMDAIANDMLLYPRGVEAIDYYFG